MSSYHIKNLEEYYQVYRKSVRFPENFWEEIAEEHFYGENAGTMY